MKKWMQDNAQNAILAAVVTCLVSAGGSLLGAYWTHESGKLSQDRQARIEQVSKFEASAFQVIEAGGQFVASINSNNKDLSAARLRISTVVATQIHESENLRKFFDRDVMTAVSNYQTALSDLNRMAQKTSSPTDMRFWAEAFGKALDAKSGLSERLYTSIGVPANASGKRSS